MGWLTTGAGKRQRLIRGRLAVLATAAVAGLGVQQCAYPYYAGPLRPAEGQAELMSTADDGTVTYTRDRLEVSLRPMTDEELNRQLTAQSQAGAKSTNPYTFSDADVGGAGGQRPSRFTVFRLRVKNYAYPKVRIDPSRIVLRTSNRREYWSLGFDQLDTYFRAYAMGYRGNEYNRYKERLDVLARTMFKSEDVFSGQEITGYIVFPVLHPDVESLRIEVLEAVLRFDYRNEPVETAHIAYQFVRDVGRMSPRGEVADR
ncbi:MAG: hypothetical protein ABIL09_02255 [Gemmatimonadota bacterium]